MNRKNARNRLILWSIIAVILVGLFFNNTNTRNWPNAFGFISMGRDDKNLRYNHNLDTINEWNIEAKNISDIDLNLTVDDVIVESTNEKNIKVIEKSNYKLNKDEYLHVSDDNQILDIYRKSNFLDNMFNNSFFKNKHRVVEIYIPKDYNKNLFIHNNVGDIEILSNLNISSFEISQNVGDLYIKEDIKCDEFIVSSHTGEVKADNINAKNYNIKAMVGDIYIKGISGKGKVESKTGDIELDINKVDGNIDILSNVGDIDLYVAEGLEFKLEAKCNVGDISSDFPLTTTNKDNNEVMMDIGDSSSHRIKVKSNVGDIKVYRR